MPATPPPAPAQAPSPAQPQDTAPNPYAPGPYPPNPYAQPADAAFAQPGSAQPGYAQAGYAQPGYAYDYGYGYPPVPPACRVCGGMPAADVTVYGHQGLIVLMRFLRQPGPYCQVCGTATVRQLSQYTLLRGWWAYLSPLFTLIALLRTRSAYQKIRQLPPPAPGTHGPQLDPGTPLTKRGAIWMLLVPLVSVVASITVLALVLVGLANSDGTDNVVGTSVLNANGGDCLRDANGAAIQNQTNPDVTVVPCGDTHAQYRVLGRVASLDNPADACSVYPAATTYYAHPNAGDSFVLCLAPNTPGNAPSSTPDDTSGDGSSADPAGSSV
ncbi:LppU/SCO3897 family protein [Kitasatospora sp. NBC_01266]|uniref:LppU/SCO3897 family protein n=1 Tax=Kitasatospora sp. NBC_01266 TaxID=2903572 RepID=UPI002E3178FD|nr:hypothetical protein [Kitasatospora sp. NBC_01266]